MSPVKPFNRGSQTDGLMLNGANVLPELLVGSDKARFTTWEFTLMVIEFDHYDNKIDYV